MSAKQQAILFFDGNCGICCRSVQFLMKRDRNGLIHYAPLQGETAKAKLNEALRQELSTAVYLPAGTNKVLLRSDAVLHATIDTKSGWRHAAKLALFVPTSWRNLVYKYVANNRTQFGSKKACALPTKKESALILP